MELRDIKKIRASLLFLAVIVLGIMLPAAANPAEMNSSNYAVYSEVISGGGNNLSSPNYKTDFILGSIAANISSPSYSQSLGFWYTTLDTTSPDINSVRVSPVVGGSGTLFNITANATDAVKVDTVTAYIQNPDENNTDVITLNLFEGLYNATWNSSNKTRGTYVIDITANDSSGNEKEKENGAAIALSPYGVNVSVNSSVEIAAGQHIIISAQNETDTWINITSSIDANISVVIAQYSENIISTYPTASELKKYIHIIVDNRTARNISAVVRVYYTVTEVTVANLQEPTLRLYKYIESSDAWGTIEGGGVNTDENYVYGSVTGFSLFAVFGNPVPAKGAPSGGGAALSSGGGIGIELIELPEKKAEFEVSPGSFDVEMVEGGSKTETLTIANTGDTELEIELDVKAIDDYLFLSEDSFKLGPAQSKEVALNFIAKETGLQTGKIIVRADGTEKVIPVLIKVESEKVLFDVKMDIPAEQRELKIGDDLLAQISLLSMGEPKKVDVFLTYLIKDLENNILSQHYETKAVERELSFVKPFSTKNLNAGDYVASIQVEYAGSIAIAGSLFALKEEYAEMPAPKKGYELLGKWFITASVILFISIIVLAAKKRKGRKAGLQKVTKRRKKNTKKVIL